MASTDATAIPVKNQAYRVTFPILDADGDLVVGATGLDSEVSKDAGTFADCTNEATQIATSSGMYYLDLTATEMNADTVAVIVKSTEGKTVPIVLYPNEGADLINSASANAIADALLKRDWDGLTGEAARSVLNALRFLRNKWSIAAGTLTVTKEDDSTSAWTAALTTDAAANPVTSSDPS